MLRPLRAVLGFGETAALTMVLGFWIASAPDSPLYTAAAAGAAAPAASLSPLSCCLIALRELLIGMFLGLPLGMLLETLPHAGRLIDSFRGAQAAELFFPGLEERSSQLELLGLLLGGLVLLFSGAAQGLLLMFRQSFHTAGLEPCRLTAHGAFAAHTVRSSAALFSEMAAGALYLASPVWLALLILDGTSLILSRALPGVRLSSELAAIRLILALLLLPLSAEGIAELAGEAVGAGPGGWAGGSTP